MQFGSFLEKGFRRPFQNSLMSGTQVFGIGRVFEFHAVTGVPGYQCVIVKDFHIA